MELQPKEMQDTRKLNKSVEKGKKSFSFLLLGLITAGLIFAIFELAKMIFH